MANLFSRLRGSGEAERSLSGQLLPYSLGQLQADIATGLNFGGQSYGPFLNQTYGGGSPHEEIPPTFTGLLELAYKANPVIFACIAARSDVFSEARFQFQRIKGGRPGDLFGTQDLALVEQPWANGTTGDLLSVALLYADLAGNFYAYRDGSELRVLRPDWVHIILGSRSQPDNPAAAYDAELLGYAYVPPNGEPRTFLPDEIAHFAPRRDPAAKFRGMSWLQPVLREITADNAMTVHQTKYFENGATPNMVVSLDSTMNQAAFERWIAAFRNNNEGLANAYKTMYLAGGADAKVVGSTLEDFKVVKGHGETRIAAAARVPAIIVGLSEGLDASTYSNYAQARRHFADGTIRPLWRNFAASMETLLNVPAGARLWYDARDVSFLAEDQGDKANILATSANTMHTLISGGYTPDSVTQFMESDGDYTLLEHSGLYSVQLQPAGAVTEGKGAVVGGVPTPTGNGPTPPPAAPSAAPPSTPAPKKPGRSAEIIDLLQVAAGAEPPRPLPRKKKRAADVFADALREDRAHQAELLRLVAGAQRPAEVHVDVQPSPAPEVRVDGAQVTVEPAEINVTLPEQAAPVANVRVEPTEVTVNVPEQRAGDVTVNVPEQAAPQVDVKVDAPQITVEAPEIRAPDVHVTLPEQPAPVVNVEGANVTVDVPGQRTPEVTVHVDVPEQATPEVNVRVEPPQIDVHVPEQAAPKVDVHLPEPKRRSLKIKRDEDGRVDGVTEE